MCDLTKIASRPDAGDGGGSGRRNAKRRVGDVAGAAKGGAAATAVNERRWPWWISRDADVSVWDWEEEEEEYPCADD